MKIKTTIALTIGLAATLLAGCVDQVDGLEGTQSLRVELIGPADPGTPEDPLDDTVRTVTLRVSALDEQNEIDADFDSLVDVYAQFLGGLTPELGDEPLAQIALDGGVSDSVDVELPPVFGPTFLWVEDGSRADATFATGTSETLWYRDPYLTDVSTPEDETALDALESSPLEGKQVAVTSTRNGADGLLVVTGVYAQGYTVSDVLCAAGAAPPCTTGNYDHILVFSFSRPKDEQGRNISLGQVIDGFTGAVQEFNGLTEIGFPQTFVSAETPRVDTALIPDPAVIQQTWLSDTIEMERHESGLVSVVDGVLCELDEEYATYKQWKLDVGAGCGSPINVITSGVVEFDPADYVGQTLPEVVGTLRPVSIGTFNVWIIYPRSSDDLTLP